MVPLILHVNPPAGFGLPTHTVIIPVRLLSIEEKVVIVFISASSSFSSRTGCQQRVQNAAGRVNLVILIRVRVHTNCRTGRRHRRRVWGLRRLHGGRRRNAVIYTHRGFHPRSSPCRQLVDEKKLVMCKARGFSLSVVTNVENGKVIKFVSMPHQPDHSHSLRSSQVQ